MGPIPGNLNNKNLTPYKKGKHHGPRKMHDPDGHMFPHWSSKEPNMCMCLDTCCQDDTLGCVCKQCPCHHGISHDMALAIHKREEG